MPAPIVFRPQYGPYDSLLANLLLSKIQHNYAMKEKELDIKAKAATLKEKRTYEEGRELGKEGRLKEAKIEEENRKLVNEYTTDKGWLTEDQVKDPVRKLTGMTKVVGGKILYYPNTPNETPTHAPMWEGDKWKMVKKENLKTYVDPRNPNAKPVYRRGNEEPPQGYVPYSSPLVTINNKPSIAEKSREETEAYVKTPKFRSDIINDVKRIRGRMWDIMEPGEQQSLIKSEADIRIKNIFPNAKFGKDGNQIGWFIPEGNGHKLVSSWSQ